MNCCLQNILYFNLHILFIIYFKTSSKNPKIIKIQQIHQKIHTKQFFIIIFKLFSICNSFEYNVTQEAQLI